ncbi:MAG TPA: MerR family transcriptional regulator [Acidimicrobiales bacterium]|nr:MerR family transcriptional regulator [Acidimicrobiales bacterium]
MKIEADTGHREYRIDDLARLAGTTVRNVRAYQDRGLLPPSRREGRIAFYSDAHLARLKVVAQLLERGYTLSNIRELLAAWEAGQDVGDLLGLEAELVAPWSDETPTAISAGELARTFGDEAVDQQALTVALELGIVEAMGEDSFVVLKPRMLHVGAELVAVGIPLAAALELAVRLRDDMDRVARGFVDLVDRYVFDPLGDHIATDELPRLTEIVRRLRPLAGEAVDAELADAMGRHVQAELLGRIDRMLADLGQSQTEAS